MKRQVLFVVAVLVVAGVFLGALARIHPFGDTARAPMDDYYLENAQRTLREQRRHLDSLRLQGFRHPGRGGGSFHGGLLRARPFP